MMKAFAKALAAAVAAGILLAGMGCTAAGLGWLASVFAPPRKVSPLYKPPARKTILVFVDDYHGLARDGPIKAQLTDYLSTQLRKHRVAKSTVGYDRVEALAGRTKEFGQLSVSEVGQKLGADLVLYVVIDQFSLKDSEAGLLWRGTLRVTARFVDAHDGSRLWPLDRPEGYPVPIVQLPLTDQSSPAYGNELCRELSERASDRVAKLFYTHYVRPEEEEEGLLPLDVR